MSATSDDEAVSGSDSDYSFEDVQEEVRRLQEALGDRYVSVN